jgi:hypothetical protein
MRSLSVMGVLAGALLGAVAAAAGCFDSQGNCNLNPKLGCGEWGTGSGGAAGQGGASSTSGMGGHDGGGGMGGMGGGGGAPMSCVPSENMGRPVEGSCGVFVSSSLGADTNAGTPAKPFKSLMAALEAANGVPVYVCGEPFSEAVTVSAAVTIYGALDCSKGWAYDAMTKTQLTAAADAVPLTLASSANGAEVLDFAITAADAMMAGGSSIAVLANQATATLTRCDLVAGNGAPGAAGMTPTVNVGPSSPADASIVGNAGAAACMSMSMQFGGAAKDNALCPSGGGGPLGGGGGVGAVTNGSNGDAQPPTTQTALGGNGQPSMDPMGLWSCASGNGGGTTGSNGMPGVSGAGAQGAASLGAISSMGYVGVGGQPGGVGAPGQGGGGGGGAKGTANCAGASGGGGGVGGCGGMGGLGGNFGGASIGLLSLGATLTFTGVTITSGNGGNGGDGGAGEIGGAGGNGGSGAAGMATSPSCSGGGGGNGGSGGQGGGGRGGHSIGIAYTGTAPPTDGAAINVGMFGAGGMGGNAAGQGAPGVAAMTQMF